MNGPMGGGPVTMTVRPRLEEGALVLTLEVSNALDEAIYFRAHPDDGLRARVLHGRAYTWLDPAGSALRVSLLSPPRDPSVDVSRAIVSLSRRLDAGARYASELVLPLPILEWNPCFAIPESADSEPVLVDGVQVTTGWFPARSVGWMEEGPEAGTYWAQGGPYRLLRVDARAERPFEVRHRLDRFERV